ncbi:MAG: ATP-binding cassette domain-containing protein, partial [Gammaproteobacteria bacterium]|nr:ATP-binding cassette domain-containing protein [Gammaproteobacteria bacterium]
TANTNGTTHTHTTNTITTAIAAQDDFGIADWLHTPCAKLSQGQLRRAALSRLLIERASLWLLDEPGVGLDRDGVARLERLLAAHLAHGGAALIATHATLSPPGHNAAHNIRLGEDV